MQTTTTLVGLQSSSEAPQMGPVGPLTGALQLSGVGRRYGSVTALDGIDLTVADGEFMVLLGPSGSGKTTLLRLIAGIDKLSTGCIRLGAVVLADRHHHVPPERRNLAMVFQDYALWPQATVVANVAYALQRIHLPRQEVRKRALAMLERVDLLRLAQRRPPELSGGEQQRVALARALVARPSILLCDEPLSNLDADLRDRLRVEIAELARERGTTVVYITHDQAEAFAMADRIGVLHGGHLVQCEPPEDLYHAPTTPFVARFTGVAGELYGHVAAGRDALGRVLIDTPCGPLLAVDHGTGSPGSPAVVLIRAAAVTILASGGDEDGLAGEVRNVAYRGNGYDHAVDLIGGTRLSGLFAEQRRRRGEAVRLAVNPPGCFAYPHEAGRAAIR